MMQSGTRSAVIFGAVILAAIIGISVGLSTLEGTMEDMGMETMQPAAPGEPATIDKSGFKTAPELVGISGYINTLPEDLPAEIEGKVVLYDIWTYSCINCIRTLPYITAWDDKYADEGLLILGIHSPEFEFEKDINNVRTAVEKNGINYPVVLDNDMETWKAFENRYWPRKYIADHEGYIRYDHIGEGAYQETERVIQELLAERAASMGMQVASAEGTVEIGEFEHTRSRTPELYLGYKFAQGRSQIGNEEGFRPQDEVKYMIPPNTVQHYFYMDGTWRNLEDGMEMVSESGSILLQYRAKQVNIVAGGAAELDITIDGRPVPPGMAGADVTIESTVITGEHDLYNIIDAEEAGSHELRIDVGDRGFEIFTFTFG